MAGVTLAREIAYDIFVAVMEDDADPQTISEELYEKHASKLKRLDRNFCKELVYGSLRWYKKIYWILQNTSKRNLDDSTPIIRAALICGTYQIFYMDRVPDRAAVNESVEYIRKKGQANAVTFVNGILRQISRKAEYFAKPDKKKNPIEYLSLQFSHPDWIVRRWFDRFGFEKTELMLSTNNKQPPTSIRINTLKTSAEEAHSLQQRLLKEERTHSDRRPLRCALTLKEALNTGPESLFARGELTVQDEAAQLVSFLVDPKEGEVIIDACSGSGGKLSHMYELSGGKAKLHAVDPQEARLNRGKQTMERLGHKDVQWHQVDFLEFKLDQPPNKILIDAPCSGLGVLKRHPEGKWKKKLSIIQQMVTIQRKLLTHALNSLPTGGEMIYAVCSFELEETSDQLSWLRENFGDKIEVISPVLRLPDYYKRYVTRDNLLHIYAGNPDELDGFGAFIVRKK